MKYISLVLLLSLAAQGQSRPSIPTVPGAKSICAQLYSLADAYNKNHPKDKANPLCGMGFAMSPKGTHEVHYALTPSEIDHLDYLRALSEVAYHDQDQYEKLLLRRHGHPAHDFSDPHWHFIGIKIGDNFITEVVDNK